MYLFNALGAFSFLVPFVEYPALFPPLSIQCRWCLDGQVIKGQHKGLMGQVVEATDTHVKVELHSKLKKVTISRNQASRSFKVVRARQIVEALRTCGNDHYR